MKGHNLNPKISIITVVFNGENYIEETIKSVINQNYKNKEYIIIDGGSKDRTIEMIKKYKKNIDYWISEPDKGIFDAMNKGIKASSGEILNMMNCGDFYIDKDVLSVVAENFFKDESISFVQGKSKFIHNDGTDYKINGKVLTTTLNAARFKTVCHQSFFYKKNLHNYFGLYDLNYGLSGDAHFIYSVYYSKDHKGKLLNKILAVRRKEGVGSSPQVILSHKRVYDAIFGRSLINEMMILKYYLKKNKFGRTAYNLYERLKYKLYC